ncbi:MAG: Hsp70 family protein [Spirochaetia bacterium]
MKQVIGIDLGTTNSAMAFMDGDEPKLIPNNRGSRITPSVVAFTPEGDVLVGESAKNQAAVNAEGTVSAVKRAMGTDRVFNVRGKNYTPVDISSFILQKMKSDAEAYLGEPITEAVITVPAYFSEPQRRATVEAGKKAGLDVRRVLNEPTAAALAYAHRMTEEKRILVYDLGGGTFDVTCLAKEENRFVVKSTGGDPFLGGLDFDRLLLKRVLESFRKQTNLPLEEDPVILQQLNEQVESAKKELSSRESATISLPFISGTGKPLHLTCSVSRREFDEIIDALVKRTIKRTQRAVADAGFGISGIDFLVLSGGSSRIPLVRRYLDRILSPKQANQVNPDEIVAMGAAVQASMLNGSDSSLHEEIILKEITSYHLGVEIEGDTFVPIIPKNSSIPARAEKIFTTVEDNQSSVEIHVMQGQSEIASNNRSLGRFLLSGIREGRKGQPRISVAFSIDADGLADVGAFDLDTGVQQRISITPLLARGENIAEDKPRDENGRLRAAFLRDRLFRLKETGKQELGPDFCDEISELLMLTDTAIGENDVKSMKECQLAMETLIGEIEAVIGKEEAEYGGA